MGGLLYKDFVAIGGKKLAAILAAATVVFAVLRILLPGTSDLGGYLAISDDGTKVALIDMFFFLGELCIIGLGSMIVNNMGPKIMEFDEKNRIRSYLFSMPVSRKKYVASKYIFIGITVYCVFSLYFLWHTVADGLMEESGYAFELSQTVGAFAIPFVCLIIFMASVELPMYFMMGKGKAMMIRVAFWMIIAFFVIGFLFFGDLTLVENWDLTAMKNWMDAHTFGLALCYILLPVLSLGVYFLSYRVTVGLYERRETL